MSVFHGSFCVFHESFLFSNRLKNAGSKDINKGFYHRSLYKDYEYIRGSPSPFLLSLLQVAAAKYLAQVSHRGSPSPVLLFYAALDRSASYVWISQLQGKPKLLRRRERQVERGERLPSRRLHRRARRDRYQRGTNRERKTNDSQTNTQSRIHAHSHLAYIAQWFFEPSLIFTPSRSGRKMA